MLDTFFPKLKFATTNGLFNQIEKVKSELKEVERAYHSEPIERVAEELADLATAAITALYIIERNDGIHPVDVLNRVVQKNIARGYLQQ